jgi:hypothetical protein
MPIRTNDVIAAVLAAAGLLLTVGYLTQCSPAARPVPPKAVSAAAPSRGAARAAVTRAPESAAERGDEENREESANIKNIAHALQTIGADPELRRTYGLPK